MTRDPIVPPDGAPPPCADRTALFYPTIDDAVDVNPRACETWIPPEAEELCRRCPYRCPCLSEAMYGEDWGVWAGTSARDRRVARHRIANGELTLADYLIERGCADR